MELKEKRNTIKIGAMIMGMFYVLPIILANRYYYDDMPEVLYLSPVWIKDGRPLTDLLMRILCGANNYIYDMFPLALLLTVAIIVTVSVKWTEKYYDTDDSIGIIVSFLPLSMGLFLSNLSYRFDCIAYAMSIMLLMIPFLIKTSSIWKKYVLNVLCVLMSMCFYQGTVGMYIGLVIILVFIRVVRREKPFEDVIMRAVSVIAAAVIYKIVIAPMVVDTDGWRAEAASFQSGSSVPVTMATHIYKIALFYWTYLKSLGARQVLLYLIIIVLGAAATFFLLEERTVMFRAGAALLHCALMPVVFIASILPISILDYPSAASRHLPALVSLMFALSVSLVLIYKKWPRVALISGLLIIMFRFSFSYVYGNTLRQQKEYADYLAQSIVHDIEGLDDDSIDEIVIDGDAPYSPVAEKMFGVMPILSEMVPPGLDKDGMLEGALINHYYPTMLNFVDWDDEVRNYLSKTHTPIMSNLIYDLYLDNNRIYVRFR